MKVVILAGGFGTRAYPYTEYLPKPMMPVGGKPILRHVNHPGLKAEACPCTRQPGIPGTVPRL